MGLERCAHAHLKLRCARFVCVSCGRWTVTIRLLLAEPPVVSSQSPCIATVVGRLCCTRLLILLQREPTKPLYNGSWSTWGLSFSKSLIIFCCLHQRIHLSPCRPHFLAHWLRCYVCLIEICLPVVPGGRIRLPFNYYITQIKISVNLFGFKYCKCKKSYV